MYLGAAPIITPMETLVLRLAPGDDLRVALDAAFAAAARDQGVQAACVISAVGSFTQAVLRYAAEPAGTPLAGPLELVTLSGTLSRDGSHLHASVSDARGQVRGGHVMPGCVVRTTAEVVVGLLAGWAFSRPEDASTGYKELLVRKVDPGSSPG